MPGLEWIVRRLARRSAARPHTDRRTVGIGELREERVEIERQGGSGAATVPVEEVLAGLNDLLQLDHDAIGAYQVAIEKLVDPNHAQRIQTFLHDHERHVRELQGRAVAELLPHVRADLVVAPGRVAEDGVEGPQLPLALPDGLDRQVGTTLLRFPSFEWLGSASRAPKPTPGAS